ncbi:MAG: hypothetical protein HYY02_13500 [Chloroflexi bacterium]|nr:hypothetical protein [Chloroflexota bacterium]
MPQLLTRGAILAVFFAAYVVTPAVTCIDHLLAPPVASHHLRAELLEQTGRTGEQDAATHANADEQGGHYCLLTKPSGGAALLLGVGDPLLIPSSAPAAIAALGGRSDSALSSPLQGRVVPPQERPPALSS